MKLHPLNLTTISFKKGANLNFAILISFMSPEWEWKAAYSHDFYANCNYTYVHATTIIWGRDILSVKIYINYNCKFSICVSQCLKPTSHYFLKIIVPCYVHISFTHHGDVS